MKYNNNIYYININQVNVYNHSERVFFKIFFKIVKNEEKIFEEFKKGVPLQMHKCDLWEEYIGLAAWKMIFHGSSKFSISLMETPRVVKN